jgi:hypothetical protein
MMTLPANELILRVYKNRGGTKKVEPPAGLVRVKEAPARLRFKCLSRHWTIKSIVFVDDDASQYFTPVDGTDDQFDVSSGTPRQFWEYDVTLKASFSLASGEQTTVEETAQGNSRPGVLVDD